MRQLGSAKRHALELGQGDLAASEGRLRLDGTDLLGQLHGKLGPCKFKLALDLAALGRIAYVVQLCPQFFDVLFDRHGLISLSS
jgi:hypothetical protein